MMLLRQPDSPQAEAATFVVGRTSRNIGAASRLGGLMTARRTSGAGGADTEWTGAIDGLARLTPEWTLEGMASGTRGVEGTGLAGYAKLRRQTSQFTASWLEAIVSRDYSPGSGFVSRSGVALHAPYLGYDWRPRWKPARIRNFKLVAYSYLYTTLDSAALEESYSEAWVDVFGQGGALFYGDLQYFTQRVTAPFAPVPGVSIAAGNYRYARPNLYCGSDRSRRLSYRARVYTGGYYDRTLDQAEVNLFASPSPRASFGLRPQRQPLPRGGNADGDDAPDRAGDAAGMESTGCG